MYMPAIHQMTLNILFIPRRGTAHIIKDLEKLYLFRRSGGRDGGGTGFYLTLNLKSAF